VVLYLLIIGNNLGLSAQNSKYCKQKEKHVWKVCLPVTSTEALCRGCVDSGYTTVLSFRREYRKLDEWGWKIFWREEDANINTFFDDLRIYFAHVFTTQDWGLSLYLRHAELFYLRDAATSALQQIWSLRHKELWLPRIKLDPIRMLCLPDRAVYASSILPTADLPDLFWYVLGRVF